LKLTSNKLADNEFLYIFKNSTFATRYSVVQKLYICYKILSGAELRSDTSTNEWWVVAYTYKRNAQQSSGT